MNEQATLGNLLNQTVEEIRENARAIGIFLAMWIPIGAITTYIDPSSSNAMGFGFGFMLTESLMAKGILAVIVVIASTIAGVVLLYWLLAAIVRQTISPGFDRFWPWFGIYLLSSIGIVFGFLILIVPGIILAIRWVMVLPLVVEADTPAMDTFGESWNRVRGYSWSILGAALILFVGVLIISSVIGGAFALADQLTSIPGVIAVAVADGISTVLFIAFPVAVYRLLHNNADELAEVFE
ncbi:glycerophosphoryl diester phosphodiesterase membrane domain-containing protein [Erythrobacter sp. MTPC3]|uniref:glycerophosphoryl diester phosphodiesterase membrane domain-containing protein n=1 Tax=Erythrobacter sp. MTPC3 TaxID=3056564 RepID=UPI0036F31DB3